MKQIEGGITAAKGFEAAGVNAGIKYKNRNDMAIIFSEKPCVAAGVYTPTAHAVVHLLPEPIQSLIYDIPASQ